DPDVLDGHVAAARRDSRPSGQADRAGRLAGRLLLLDGDRAAGVDRPRAPSALVCAWSRHVHVVESVAAVFDRIEDDRVELLPGSVDRELLVGGEVDSRADPEAAENRGKGLAIRLDLAEALHRQGGLVTPSDRVEVAIA